MRITYKNLERAGRFGNQLWEIASTVGIARSLGALPQFPAGWSYRKYFNVPDEFFSDEPIGVEATDYVPHMDVRCKAYLQDLNLFIDIQDEVREWFSLSETGQEVLEEHLVKTNQQWIKDESYVSLHVRRGDNVNHPPEMHPLQKPSYYRRALKHFGDAQVVVFSDDIPWCEEVLPEALDRELLFIKDGPARGRDYLPEEYLADEALDWIDMKLMQLCTAGHIIPNSTYSWWAAFLEGGKTVYPSHWFGRKLSYINWKLMMPKEWEMV